MGLIKEFRCPSCRKEWKISTGHGRNHATLKRVLGAFPSDTRQRILTDVKKDSEPLFLFQYHTAVCHPCRSLVSVPVLRFLETGQTFKGKCPVCGGELEIPEDDSHILCPQCQKQSLTVQEIGHWD